jgi:hypothetical protein
MGKKHIPRWESIKKIEGKKNVDRKKKRHLNI